MVPVKLQSTCGKRFHLVLVLLARREDAPNTWWNLKLSEALVQLNWHHFFLKVWTDFFNAVFITIPERKATIRSLLDFALSSIFYPDKQFAKSQIQTSPIASHHQMALPPYLISKMQARHSANCPLSPLLTSKQPLFYSCVYPGAKFVCRDSSNQAY